ncbi:zinc finger CCHC domain-containing protein 12-like [Fundulus heteroclitus]|uniref:zinc finger CCHC domain-containing protein 12-like n=1 Tax=Fundulus heteroclitus TaxID=8078 RepID=UPI00165C3148|nr:zinc finger CCHC domain-containing protein 12-like [Fundulus heteroclitus]
MDVVQTSSVKIPNSVIVSGMTNTETDDELYDFLKQHGSIQRVIPVDLTEPESAKQVIVEYVYGTAMQSLLPSLPYRLSNKTKTDVTYHIRALANVYTPVASKTATQTYLSELKDIAKLTGKDFAAVLREELSLISETVDLDHSETQDEDTEQSSPDTPEQHAPEYAAQVSPLPSTALQQHVQHHRSPPSTPSKGKTQPALKLSDVNPPDIQKVIVEHIVRNEDSALQVHTPLRLRPFSGRVPRPNSEVDYETWRSNVELLLKDITQSDPYKSRKLLESLLSPAIDIVKHLTPDSPLSAYLEILDSAFGTVEDGDDLFAKYLNTMQDNGEKPSAYLQRLQVALSTTLRRGGVTASDLDRHLLRQFVRGCWDNILIAELQLEQKKQNPPSFAELLLLLRTAEDKRSSKASRMKQHFNVSKPRVSSHYQGVYMQGEENCSSSQPAPDHRSEIQDLKKQIADLQSQLTRITQKDSRKAKSTARPLAPQTANTRSPAITHTSQGLQLHSRDANISTSNRPKPWYCFRCGEDGHIKPQCESEPNPSLVAEKRKQLKEKQSAWDSQHGTSKPDPLN